eukprot:CAMPEP_0119297896 /NCGR_PEP_ID=MMETSP1333-20130426/83_1 /TAXON_ID=418940 /ORGANISM="Scyphosphaera apsteinii, Strain RCC1455" /LENGTH=727 /DNA_ID=CAMNT_0007298855 /DNA_START=34 /DNA_END=2217 /DNA_ORIENTATION=+
MTDYDQGAIFFSDQGRDSQGSPDDSPTAARMKFREFIRTFRLEEDYIYRDLLRSAIGMGQHVFEVNVDHLMQFDDVLANALLRHPAHHLQLFEQAALEAAIQMAFLTETSADEDKVAIQVTLVSSKQDISIRQLLSGQVSRIVTVPGIVISASRVKAKATKVFAQCSNCQHVKQMSVRAGFAGAQLPRVCDRERQPNETPCPLDPFKILPNKCEYVDQQTWKLQESPEMVPTGEMPRSVLMSVDRHLVDKATPGHRVMITGIMSILNQQAKGEGKVAIRTPYLQVLGVRQGFESKTSSGMSLSEFTQADEEQFIEMSRDPELYSKLCKSIAPSIFGSEEVKKAIVSLLFSGSRKELADGARLRGDINVLLLGDPSVAKSQFLKFVEKAAPISVYTSGKGSSAAGLTATVTQDPGTREFYLEGGAMVLADGGVVCIDEFDKMREQDRVAIHEAMEQQTISIAKAGITTVLNSRSSVLAAANPTFGRYQEEKNAAEQIDFQTTILSRFDMIFVIKDKYDNEKDLSLAKHIINVHVQGATALEREPTDDEYDILTLKRYVAFARKTCSPRLAEAAATVLSNFYVQVRQDLSKADAESEANGKAPRAVPITVRQLEAIVRISESIAKMRLSDEATEDDVNQAIELFRVSTLQAAKQGDIELEGGSGQGERTAMDQIKKRVRIGESVSTSKLVHDVIGRGLEEVHVRRAINMMCAKGEFTQTSQGKRLKREN